MNKNDVAISVNNVSKEFRLPKEKSKTVKGSLINFARRKHGYIKQKALNNVSFEVKKGEFFGIVGRNGSGKSTLLKCMAGVYYPTKGNIDVNGTLVPFIELGVGFNPELTGRDNVFLNGALLGFEQSQMEELYDEIVEFAELEDFMDQKLKNYSSGMQVRLAFSIAIQAKGEILLLDEVLAVGDEAFQKKCFKYFDELKRNKRTVILVTHSMANVEEFCDRAIFIDKGVVKEIGEPSHIAHLYRVANKDALDETRNNKVKEEDLYKSDIEVYIKNKKHNKTKLTYSHNEEIILTISWKEDKIKNVGVALYSGSGKNVFAANTVRDEANIKNKTIEYSLKLNVADGNYYFKLGFFGKNEREKIYFIEKGPDFSVYSESSRKWEGITMLQRSWK